MRKVVVSNLISADGRYEGSGGNVMALPFDDLFSTYNAERLRAAGTLLLGRRSFEGFQSYWPTVTDDAAQPPIEREISRLNNAIDKVVVSDTLTLGEDDAWSAARVVPRAEAHRVVAELRVQDGAEILIFGSHILWNDLLRAGLVDEVHLMVGSAFLGSGTPVFDGEPGAALDLVEVRSWPGAQLVLLRYEARRES